MYLVAFAQEGPEVLLLERIDGRPARLVAHDPEFWRYLGNTLFLMLGIPLSIIGSLLLALLLNQRLRGITVFRTIYFLPTVSSAVAVCIVWKWIFHQQPNEIGLAMAGAAWFGTGMRLSFMPDRTRARSLDP